MNATLLRRIALASVRRCPDVVPSCVLVLTAPVGRLPAGYEYSAGGSSIGPSRIERRGYVYRDPSGCTYGKRYASEPAARFAWHYRQLRSAVRFLRELRRMSDEQLESQASYWLKEVGAS